MDDPLARAILETLHYADIFDFPLTDREIERYLIGLRASPGRIQGALLELVRRARVGRVGRFFTLPGRESIVPGRMHLAEQAQVQQPRAHFYGRLLGYFPFVRMVALTGALAMENARDDDIDLFVICSPGHLWTVRGAAVALVYLARLRGDHVCPNFLLTENRLKVAAEDLYNAHEIVQMIPLFGFDVYRKLLELNPWVARFLPNASNGQEARRESRPSAFAVVLKRTAELILKGRLGAAIEHWEMSRKIRKLSAQVPADADDVEFSAEACRGFFSGHGRRVLEEFARREIELESTAVYAEAIPVYEVQGV